MAEQTINQEQKQEEVKTEEVKVEQTQKQEQPEKVETEQKDVKTFTEEEVAKLVQSQVDKRVTDALKTAKTKWENEYQTKLQEEKAEAERLANMTAKERKEEEIRKIQEQIDIERAEFEKQREQFEREKLTLSTVKELNAKKLPVEFAEFLVTGNEETTKSNLEKFEEKWNATLQQAIEKHVQERLQSTTKPKTAPKVENRIMTRKEFANLPYAERQKLIAENPDIVKQILGQK